MIKDNNLSKYLFSQVERARTEAARRPADYQQRDYQAQDKHEAGEQEPVQAWRDCPVNIWPECTMKYIYSRLFKCQSRGIVQHCSV